MVRMYHYLSGIKFSMSICSGAALVSKSSHFLTWFPAVKYDFNLSKWHHCMYFLLCLSTLSSEIDSIVRGLLKETGRKSGSSWPFPPLMLGL